MAVFAIPNPKKSIIVDFPIERIKQSVQNIRLVNNKYKFTKANEIFNQYTYESLEFLSLGIFADINLNSLAENKTEITIEIRRKIGSFNQSYEVTKANEHIDKIFAAIANLTAKSPEQIEQLKNAKNATGSAAAKKKDERPFYKKKRFIIPAALIVLGIIVSQFNNDNKNTSISTQTEATTSLPELTQAQKDSIKAVEDSVAKAGAIAKKKWENSRAGRIQKKHPDWSDEDCERLAKHQIWIGMEYEMVVYLRGKPNTVNTSNYGDGQDYQACWDNYDPSCFYFGEDHIITSYN